jgi:ribose transport system permease protein
LTRFPRKEFGLLVLLIVLCAAGYGKNHAFLGSDNVQNTLRLIGLYGVFSLGAAFVIITGGIDLSVGSLLALLGVLFSMALRDWHWGALTSLGFILALGAALGWTHGFLISRVRLQPFIVTLCGLLLYRGLARFVAHDETKGFGNYEGFEWLQKLASGTYLGVPMPFLFMICLSIVLGLILHRTVYGRHLFAVGNNEEAARYSGINTKRVLASVYILSALLTAIASIFIAFFTNSVSPSSHGNFYELYGIAAAVLGGCSLRGGEGSIFGVLIGVALLQVLQNLVNLLGIDSSLNFAVMGAVILVGVLVDQLLTRRSARESA